MIVFRLFDWSCLDCERAHEEVIEVESGKSAPETARLLCPTCERVTAHQRMLPLVAQYMGEKPMAPQVFGGRFDTMGREKAPPPPGESASRSEVADWAREKKAVDGRNKAKRKRAKAGVDFRRNPLPGDPKWK